MSQPVELVPVPEPDPEPTFTIRAGEITTPTIINMAIHYYKLNGVSQEELLKLIDREKQIDEWRERNPDKLFRLGVENG